MIFPATPQGLSGSTPPPDRKQLLPLVRRLERITAEYLTPARKMKIPVSADRVMGVVAQVILVLEEKQAAPEFDTTAEGYYYSGLFDEIHQQAGQIFEEHTDPAGGHKHFVPIPPATFLACLRLFLETLSTPPEPDASMPPSPPPAPDPRSSEPTVTALNHLFKKR